MVKQVHPPLPAIKPVEVDARSFSAIPGDDHVLLASVEVRGEHRVGVHERRVNDLAPPHALVFRVHRHLIAVPRLDGGEETFLAEPAGGYIAGAAFRPGIWVPGSELGSRP